MVLRFSKLTRPNIRTLSSSEKITEHGITAERLRHGDIRYSINIMVDGERIHRVVGRESDDVTRTQAEELVEKVRTEAREGRLALPKGRKTHLTFEKAADDYLKRLEDTCGKNLKVKRRHLKHQLKPFFGSQRLNSVTTFTVDRYKKKRKVAGAAEGTINRELTTLSHLFSMAVEWKWITSKPCKIAKHNEERGRIIVLSDDEADALLGSAIADQDPYLWLFVMFGLNTARSTRHLEPPTPHPGCQVRLSRPAHNPRVGRGPENEQQMANDPAGWIFPSLRPGLSRLGHRTHMGRPFRRAVIGAGLDPEKVTPHVMRHTAITNLVQAGVDLPTIQQISGHKTLAMVMRYTHVHGRHIDRAVRVLGRKLPERGANKTPDTVTPELHTIPRRPA